MTATSFLSQIDWSQPWLLPFREIAAPIVQAGDWRHAINEAAQERDLRNHRGLPMRFVPQSELPAGTAYETFISETACIPTRDNLHDFFNALIWLSYPKTKARLNALQAEAITQAGTTQVRGKLRDAITVFDENAAIFIADEAQLVEALRNHAWQTLFLEKRSAFGQSYHVCLFGHALLEKLVHPYKAITAHAYPLVLAKIEEGQASPASTATLDAMLAPSLSGNLSTRTLLPLPVLGLPGWQAGQDEAYYDDANVFRPVRSQRK